MIIIHRKKTGGNGESTPRLLIRNREFRRKVWSSQGGRREEGDWSKKDFRGDSRRKPGPEGEPPVGVCLKNLQISFFSLLSCKFTTCSIFCYSYIPQCFNYNTIFNLISCHISFNTLYIYKENCSYMKYICYMIHILNIASKQA